MIPNDWLSFAKAIREYALKPDECLAPEEQDTIEKCVTFPAGPVVSLVNAFELLRPHFSKLGLEGSELLLGCSIMIQNGPNFHNLGADAQALEPLINKRIEELNNPPDNLEG